MAHIYQGFQGEYYVIDGIKYDAHFPEEWARDHKDFEQEPHEDYLARTGPEKCGNCAFYGTLRGVFIGYCGNCAREYNFERGRSFCFDFTQEEMWEKLDYMKNVPITQVGDEEIETENYEPEIREIRERKQREKKAQMKKNKKGKERRIRRALRKRQNNEEYIGMPRESLEKGSDVEFYIFLIYIFLMFLFLVPIFLLSR